MTTENFPDDPDQPPIGEPTDTMSEELSNLASKLCDGYPGTFRFNRLGDHLLYADAFTRLAEPHLPLTLRQDALLLRRRIDEELRDTLAACILSIEDVTGGPRWTTNNNSMN